MSLYVDLKYARILGARLPNFKQFKPNNFKFSHDCESDTHGKLKTRGYIFPAGDSLNVYCHHCGLSKKLGSFLSQVDPTLYSEYRFDQFKDNSKITTNEVVDDTIFKSNFIPSKIDTDRNIIWCSTLHNTHPVLTYVKSREIPSEYYSRIGYVDDFNKFASKYNPVFEKSKKKYPRLIIPFYSEDDFVIGYSCRAFGNEQPKYINLQIDEDVPLIYGLWKLDKTKDIFATEGQIDSMFLDNSISVGGADYDKDIIKNLKDKIIIVPDSDYKRNPNVYKQLMKVVDKGFKISLFPESIQFKDINECITKGKLTSEAITKLLTDNVVSGPGAKMELIYRRRFEEPSETHKYKHF